MAQGYPILWLSELVPCSSIIVRYYLFLVKPKKDIDADSKHCNCTDSFPPNRPHTDRKVSKLAKQGSMCEQDKQAMECMAYLLNGAADCTVAKVGVDFDQEVAPPHSGLQLCVALVGRDDGPPPGHLHHHKITSASAFLSWTMAALGETIKRFLSIRVHRRQKIGRRLRSVFGRSFKHHECVLSLLALCEQAKGFGVPSRALAVCSCSMWGHSCDLL